MSNIKTLGTPRTIGELKKLINQYPDSAHFGFRNQPIQMLIEDRSKDEIFISFQEQVNRVINLHPLLCECAECAEQMTVLVDEAKEFLEAQTIYTPLQEITRNAVNNLNNQFDEIVVKGLERHGYIFKTTEELEGFIREHCRVVTSSANGIKTYCAKNVPFLEHHPARPEVEFQVKKDGSHVGVFTSGKFRFL